MAQFIIQMPLQKIVIASFQTGSDDRVTAEEYANSENSIFLEISLPERWNNWVNIKTTDQVIKNEFIIMPYTSFKLGNY